MDRKADKPRISNIPDGWIKAVTLIPPSLHNNTSDADRLKFELEKQLDTDGLRIDLNVLMALPFHLRSWDYAARCILIKDGRQWRLIGISPPTEKRIAAGVAADLGTSRVALRLVDLSTGQILSETSFDNPQLVIGPDILTRIHFCDQEGGLEKLHALIMDGLNRQIQNLCRVCSIGTDDVYLVALSGNTSMTHLFMGLPPRWIIREPYIPVVNRPAIEKAKDLGLHVNPAARVFVFPNIGSYFGGDLIAGILFCDMHEQEETAMLIDVGTNAEAVLGNRNWLIGCAGAAGPALEGGVTKMGMMAGPGVIDRISIDHETHEFHIHTIDNEPPIGICGSGVIDLAAGLFLAGMIDKMGRFIPKQCGKRLHKQSGMHYLEIVSADEAGTGNVIAVSQADLDSLIRSKAAMYSILETMMESVGLTPDDVSKFYVAGAFGVFINPASAVAIGMLPDLPFDKFKPLGNSSLEGATQVLLSSGSLDTVDKISDKITYLELNVNQAFMNRFSAAKFLPHTDPSLFPSIHKVL